MREVLIGLVVVAVVALIEGLLHTFRFFQDRREDELRRRLQSLGEGNAGGMLLRRGKLSENALVESLLRGIPTAERLELLIEQAQVRLTVASLLSITAFAVVLGLGLGLLARSLPLAVLLGLVGLLTPIGIVYAARERRSVKLSEQLPDALDMMARSLRAGHALPSAFKLVATEMPVPVSIEFGHAFEEQNLGVPFDR